MSVIKLKDLSKAYGDNVVLDKVNININAGEKIGIIGVNGTGKSTLMKIIMGEEDPDNGKVELSSGTSIGYLKQATEYTPEDFTKMTSDKTSISDFLKTTGELSVSDDIDFSAERLQNLSGGEKTKIALSSILATSPSVLLLDEPTNHLDIDTLEWFEHFLSSYKGTIIMSSHDRYFLDKVATKTILIDKGKADVYHGNYSYFLEESDRRALAEFDEYKTQQKQIEAMKATVKKLKEWGERGDNPRFFRRAACIERKLEKMELLDRPESKKQLPLDFEINGRSGKDVLVADDLGIIIGDKVILDGANMHLKYGEKVCLMGKNGTGKSTFIKTVLGDDNICQGEIKIGSSVSIGYIPQEIRFEDEDATVLETARRFYDGTETHLRASLAKFLFYGENVFKRVGKLSGGEKVRLKLFELIQKKANLLILDEPTNHIDIDTKEMLEEALGEYQGTLFFISHDRYFINKLAQRVINIEDQTFNEYLGNYDYFKEQKVKKLMPPENTTSRRR